MLQAVVFDWFGTLARWADGARRGYSSILAAHGLEVDEEVLGAYHSSWDGAAHPEHSTSREAYLAWTRGRLAQLAAACGAAPAEVPVLVEQFLEADESTPMVAYPETLAVLDELNRRGLSVVVCSNWGWDLDPYLESTGVARYVAVPVTSARAGYRKPHPEIYALTLSALGVGAAETLFVGDSWGPDVLGPISVGMRSVHVVRDPRAPAPELVERAARVASLEELLDSALLLPGRRR
jgi:putative hydrolase of the HAD superfamily